MVRHSEEQRKTIERVMHEFKHDELDTGSGKKVEKPKQAIAIALREAGASKYESEEKNEENLRRTKQRERRARSSRSGETKQALYEKAKERGIEGRSRMSKQELARALSKGAS